MSGRATEAQVRRAAGSQSLALLKDAVRGWTVPELNDMAKLFGKNAVHMAAWQGCLENLVYLLEELGCNVNVIATGEFSYGKTPIFFAATRSRNDVVDFLLDRGAFVKIVNNKGQSVLSIAWSHLSPSMIAKIELREHQQTAEWWNFRATHSDGLEYGDLDPRFLDRPIRPNNDLVTRFAVNPTTKLTRKGAFLKRNPEHGSREKRKQDKDKQLKRAKQKSKRDPKEFFLSEADKQQLEVAWREINISFCPSLLMIVSIWDKVRRPWVADVANDLHEIFPQVLDLEAQICTIHADGRQKLLLNRLVVSVRSKSWETTTGHEEIRRSSQRPSKLADSSNSRTPPSLLCGLWREACNAVRNLSISNFENQDCTVLTLSFPPVWVDSIVGLKKLSYAIATERLVAFDTEWASSQRLEPGSSSLYLLDPAAPTVSILQIATKSHVWVIDLLKDCVNYRQECGQFIRYLFNNKIVLGFAIRRDILALQKWLQMLAMDPSPCNHCSIANNCLDLQLLWCNNDQLPGLATCALEFSQLRLSKSEQCSDWVRRPITASQISYAGLDALILPTLLAEKAKQLTSSCNL